MDGQCVAQPSDVACGIGGASCQNCALFGKTCNVSSGACVEKQVEPGPSSCNAQNCGGCCQNGKCVLPTDAACGLGGVACVNCSANGNVCDTQQGICRADDNPPVACNASNCANGCCQNGQCITTLTNTACGSGGNACTACQSGQICNAASGVCESGGSSTCNASNCATGCCQNNQCITTLTNTACGTGGNACVACQGGQICNTGTGACQNQAPTCSASTCPNGCCQNGQCITTLSDTACGKGGGACSTCNSASQQCDTNTGQCVPKQSTATYPPGPYGSSVGNTLKDQTFPNCSGGNYTAKSDMFKKKEVHLIMLSTGAG